MMSMCVAYIDSSPMLTSNRLDQSDEGKTVRRTRIVATIGPASDTDEVLLELVKAGVDVFRLSMAHGDIPSCIERLRRVRALAPDLAIMVDIPGPKIRAGSFGTIPVVLEIGSELELVEGFGESSTKSTIYVEREDILGQLKVGDRIHLGDGGVSLQVLKSGETTIAKIISGGAVMGKPGLSLPSSILNDRLPTDDDRARLEAPRPSLSRFWPSRSSARRSTWSQCEQSSVAMTR